jgi:spermidine synthase
MLLMRYQQILSPSPSPLFELRVKTNLEHCVAVILPRILPRHLMRALTFYIGSMLLAENLPPHPNCIIKFLDMFSGLLSPSGGSKPILHKKDNTLSLMFDAFSVQSEMNVEDPDDLMLAYTQTMMGFLLFKLKPKNIGMIGLGGGSLVKFCHRHLPASAIAVAEIDPQVIALRDSFLIPRDSERLNVACLDGAEFVRRTDAAFDVLLIDGFDNNGQPRQLCSQAFYDDCYKSLTPDGLMAVNLLGGDIWETEGYLNRMRHSFRGSVIAVNSLDSFNIIAFAWKDKALNLDRETLSARMRQLTMLHPVILRETAQAILSGQQQIALRLESSAQSKQRNTLRM